MGCDREDSAEAVECLRRKPSRELVDQDVQPARYSGAVGEGWGQAFRLLAGSKTVEGERRPQAFYLARRVGLQGPLVALPSFLESLP